MIKTDIQAWDAYPNQRQWFNKLWVSEQLGYLCGPAGVPVPTGGEYVTRPIYNLHGMSAGVQYRTFIDKTDDVPPGHFWCQRFYGEHISVEYKRDQKERWYVPTSAWLGVADITDPTRFRYWKRVHQHPELPLLVQKGLTADNINVEYIGRHAIEVHLRATPDPVGYDMLISVWSDDDLEDMQTKYSKLHFEFSPDIIWGTQKKRIGFFCK